MIGEEKRTRELSETDGLIVTPRRSRAIATVVEDPLGEELGATTTTTVIPATPDSILVSAPPPLREGFQFDLRHSWIRSCFYGRFESRRRNASISTKERPLIIPLRHFNVPHSRMHEPRQFCTKF